MRQHYLLSILLCYSFYMNMQSQNVGTTRISDWNQLYTSGFYDSYGAFNDPVSFSDSLWCWGVNIAHTSNKNNYRYNGQIVVANDSQKPSMFIRSTNEEGYGVLGKVVINNGDAMEFNSDLRIGQRHDPLYPRISVHQSRTLGQNKGDFITLSSTSGDGDGGNTLFNRTYIQRRENGGDWATMRFVDGIGIDASFTVPGQSSRTWWERNPHDDVQLWGNEGMTHMVLNSGNLGIGTLTPNHKLEVAGTIRAQEIKIEATNWPDYVFSPSYQLQSLSDVERYIQENKHLPGIPSEQEVKEEGISVGEMNAKLLQKIEELTLYIIQQDKYMTQQNKRIENLEQQLNHQK